MDVEFDLAKARSNLAKHGITFEEAATCLLDPHALVIEDGSTRSEPRWILLGLSDKGRLLTVVYTLRGENPRLISAPRRPEKRLSVMRKEYDFSKGRRASEIPHLTALRKTAKNKTRISIMLDDEVIAGFRKRAEAAGVGYQTEINRALHEALASPAKKPLTLDAVRRVVREELNSKRM